LWPNNSTWRHPSALCKFTEIPLNSPISLFGTSDNPLDHPQYGAVSKARRQKETPIRPYSSRCRRPWLFHPLASLPKRWSCQDIRQRAAHKGQGALLFSRPLKLGSNPALGRRSPPRHSRRERHHPLYAGRALYPNTYYRDRPGLRPKFSTRVPHPVSLRPPINR
jgi:hypothetical protein